MTAFMEESGLLRTVETHEAYADLGNALEKELNFREASTNRKRR
jgi:hypothetical protein